MSIRSTIELPSGQAYRTVWPSNGVPAHFFHANAFPPDGYGPLLDQLSRNTALTALWARPLWKEPGRRRGVTWSSYADDLIAYLDQVDHPVVGVGHSMGATATLEAAARRPDLFLAVIAVEPVILPLGRVAITRLAPDVIKHGKQPLKATLEKPDRWPSREAAFRWFRDHRAYRRIATDRLDTFLDSALAEDEQGMHLAFTVPWEVHNYGAPSYVGRHLKKVRCPVLALRGKPSLFLEDDVWNHWQRIAKGVTFHSFPENGHLLPLEAPEAVAARINSWMEQCLPSSP